MLEIKRKFIQLDFDKLKEGYFTLGIKISLHNFEKNIEYPEYNVKHGHLYICLGIFYIDTSFMDLQYE